MSMSLLFFAFVNTTSLRFLASTGQLSSKSRAEGDSQPCY